MLNTRRQTWFLLSFVAVSTPLALVAETGLRKLMFPPEFEELRSFLEPRLTTPVWIMCAAVIGSTYLGVRMHARRVRKRMAARPESEQTDHYRNKENFDAMMLSTSLPQVPAIFVTFMYMFGAPLVPVLITLGVATAGVLVVGVVGMRKARTLEPRTPPST